MKERNFKLIGLLAGALAILALALAGPVAGNTDAAIKWMSYESAKDEGVKNGKKYFMYFSTSSCGYCRMLEKKTFTDKEIISYINANFIPVHVKADTNRKVAMQYRVRGVPDLQFLSDEGAVIGRWVSYIEADRLLKLLKFINTDSYLKMSFKTFVEQQ